MFTVNACASWQNLSVSPVASGRRNCLRRRFNYELFNCSKINIRYWSWNYRLIKYVLASSAMSGLPSTNSRNFDPNNGCSKKNCQCLSISFCFREAILTCLQNKGAHICPSIIDTSSSSGDWLASLSRSMVSHGSDYILCSARYQRYPLPLSL